MKTPLVAVSTVLLMLASPTWAKLPPLNDEAKAKAAEAAAKTAHAGKVDAYKLCKSMDQVAATYFDRAKQANKTVPAAAQTAACADPGPFVYVPAAAAPAPGAVAPAAAGATPAAAAATAVAAVKNSAGAPTAPAMPAAPKK
jgi:hypothetical protein